MMVKATFSLMVAYSLLLCLPTLLYAHNAPQDTIMRLQVLSKRYNKLKNIERGRAVTISYEKDYKIYKIRGKIFKITDSTVTLLGVGTHWSQTFDGLAYHTFKAKDIRELRDNRGQWFVGVVQSFIGLVVLSTVLSTILAFPTQFNILLILAFLGIIGSFVYLCMKVFFWIRRKKYRSAETVFTIKRYVR